MQFFFLLYFISHPLHVSKRLMFIIRKQFAVYTVYGIYRASVCLTASSIRVDDYWNKLRKKKNVHRVWPCYTNISLYMAHRKSKVCKYKFCKCLSYVGCNELALVEQSLCYETEVIILIWIIHDRLPERWSISRPRKEFQVLHRMVMGVLERKVCVMWDANYGVLSLVTENYYMELVI
jgi:hypothetical protein